MIGEHWQLLLFFAGLLSAWSGIIIVTTRWTVTKGLSTYDIRMAAIDESIRKALAESQQREREILLLRAELPNIYVRREDAIRQETVINAKLDMLAAKIDNLRVKYIPGETV